MEDKYLPIGTVVILKDGEKRLMITGYLPVTYDNVYDYCGCSFPEGIFDSNLNALFNHSQIKKIYHMGLYDDESKDFFNKLHVLAEEQKNN